MYGSLGPWVQIPNEAVNSNLINNNGFARGFAGIWRSTMLGEDRAAVGIYLIVMGERVESGVRPRKWLRGREIQVGRGRYRGSCRIASTAPCFIFWAQALGAAQGSASGSLTGAPR
jgi:hypothetical protein